MMNAVQGEQCLFFLMEIIKRLSIPPAVKKNNKET
jgi:hypothetical protein